MEFTQWSVNRLKFPNRWVMICEDDIEQQIGLLKFFADRYGHQGDVLTVICPSAIIAYATYAGLNKAIGEPIAILVDHDMPYGNGVELINAIKEAGYIGPFVAISGISENNDRLRAAGASFVARNKGQDPMLTAYFNDIEKSGAA